MGGGNTVGRMSALWVLVVLVFVGTVSGEDPEIWWNKERKLMEPAEVQKRISEFHELMFTTDKTKGSLSSLHRASKFTCEKGANINMVAPVKYQTEGAQHYKFMAIPNCRNLEEDEITWPALQILENAWVDGSGKAASCAGVGHEGGGGASADLWSSFPGRVNSSISLKDKKGQSVTVYESFFLVEELGTSSFRFFSQTLPKLLAAYSLIRKRSSMFLVVPPLQMFQDILIQLGEKQNRLLPLREHEWVMVNRAMYIAPTTEENGAVYPFELDSGCFDQSMHDMFNYVFMGLQPGKEPEMDRIIVLIQIAHEKSETPADCTMTNCLTNGDELMKEISKKFKDKKIVEIWPQDYRLERITYELSRAKVLLGLNGNGFGFLHMLQTGSTVVDINYLYPRTFYKAYTDRRGINVKNVVSGLNDRTINGTIANVQEVVKAMKNAF